MRFPPAQVAALLEAAWWGWPIERIAEAIPALVHGPVEALTRA
jgi:virginiamycin A acetyltransferase